MGKRLPNVFEDAINKRLQHRYEKLEFDIDDDIKMLFGHNKEFDDQLLHEIKEYLFTRLMLGYVKTVNTLERGYTTRDMKKAEHLRKWFQDTAFQKLKNYKGRIIVDNKEKLRALANIVELIENSNKRNVNQDTIWTYNVQERLEHLLSSKELIKTDFEIDLKKMGPSTIFKDTINEKWKQIPIRVQTGGYTKLLSQTTMVKLNA